MTNKYLRAVGSTIAAIVAGYVGSEIMEGLAHTHTERERLARTVLTAMCGVWCCWEMLQVRRHLGVATEWWRSP